MAEQTGSSGLFAVFLLAIYSLVLIIVTFNKLCSAGEEGTTQPVVKVGDVGDGGRHVGLAWGEGLAGGCPPLRMVLMHGQPRGLLQSLAGLVSMITTANTTSPRRGGRRRRSRTS